MRGRGVLLAAGLALATLWGCSGKAPAQDQMAALEKGPGGFFVSKGCWACHNVSSFGIPALRPMGPDLALAVEDAPRRFGMPVEEFLEKPAGTMAIVLATRIPLTPEERALAAQKLHEAWEEHLKQATSGTGPSHGSAPVAVTR